MICRLCSAEAEEFFKASDKRYYRCRRCSGVFLDPACYVSREDEKRRYLEHNNDVEDSGYQKFVEPVVLKVQEEFGRKHRGLDFGAGTGPVVTKLLGDKGYKLELYDPFFCKRKEVLQQQYDFIVCCEVIEHFHFPFKEFKFLKSLLNPGGVLYCMTSIYSEKIDFNKWDYKDDSTHVFFYHEDSLHWIKSEVGFSSLEIQSRLVQFSDRDWC